MGGISRQQAAAELLARRERRASLLRYTLDTHPRYLAGWFHAELCSALEWFSQAVARGESPRLIVNTPPRGGKSTLVSETWPTWHLGHYPEHDVVTAAYGQELANRFSRNARAMAMDQLTAATFPGLRLADDRAAVTDWRTTAGGGYKAVGVGGGLTGHGAHALGIDDPLKDRKAADSELIRRNVWEWYTSTAYTRLAPGGGILLTQTRWHEDDLTGRLLLEQQAGGDQWRVLVFPAIAEVDEPHRRAGEALHPERYSLEQLLRIKRNVGSREWEALYQQRPAPNAGTVVDVAWFKFYRLPPEQTVTMCDWVLTSWDATFKDNDGSDYVVGQVWGRKGANKYLLDQVRARMTFTATRAAMLALAAKWPQATMHLIEDKANGSALLDTLRDTLDGLVAVEPQGSKLARAQAVAPQVEAGQVWLPAPQLPGCGWVHDYVQEWRAFPNGAHDDQVDGSSQALHRLGVGTHTVTGHQAEDD